MELIDAMPPGLYEIVIKEKQSTEVPSEGEAADFDLCIEERGLDDIRALGCNSLEDEREFAAVARVSELNNALYQTFLQPWIKMISGPQLARAAIELNPLRLSYSSVSDRNPMMRAVAPLANYVRAERIPASDDNPYVAMQQWFSKAMVEALNLYRDTRDRTGRADVPCRVWLAPGSGRLRNLPERWSAPAPAWAVALCPGGSRGGETSLEGTDRRG